MGKGYAFGCGVFFAFLSLQAKDLDRAPPPFDHLGRKIIPVDFSHVDIALHFDIPTKSAHGRARILFQTQEKGFPFIDLVSAPRLVSLDGLPLENGSFIISPPGEETLLRVLAKEVEPHKTHILELAWKLESNAIEFTEDQGIRVHLGMSDLTDRNYSEKYVPANLEFDRYKMRYFIRVTGARRPLHVMANGDIKRLSDQTYQVVFPHYFTTSCPFIDVTDFSLAILNTEYSGMLKKFPVQIYATKENRDLIVEAKRKTFKTLEELEKDYGAFAHPRFIGFIRGRKGGGMEYAGATSTSMGALAHEITHSWFARGVLPADGNAGWVDEATASWRDQGYPRPHEIKLRNPVNLAGFSNYRRFTPREAYGEGSQLLGELDHFLAKDGGLKPILAKWYQAKMRKVFQTPEFLAFIQKHSRLSFKLLFDRYVFGRGDRIEGFPEGTKFCRARLEKLVDSRR